MKNLTFIKYMFQVFVMLILVSNVFVIAVLANDSFEVTGGIDKTKEVELTFDSSRIISGTVPQDSSVIIEIFDKNDEVNQTYNIDVGSSGYFSQTINLLIGENKVIITLCSDEESSFEYIIKRKKLAIKSALSQTVALPIA